MVYRDGLVSVHKGFFSAGLRFARVLGLRRTFRAPHRKPLCDIAGGKIVLIYALDTPESTIHHWSIGRVLPVPCQLEVDIKGFVIAGTQSGCGKTTIALGLMAALAERGMRVVPFEV